ncbi:MAG: histidinol-phosphatase HisJ [Gorillibacterium sp.]|nr:histidinol-phosphatase HisJ [Gorillibacterium sp.]
MKKLLKWNGHTHTSFCRHGSSAAIEEYIREAIRLGFKRYTLSEHPPLPVNLVPDPELMRELAMEQHELPDYLTAAKRIKERYEDQIDVLVGLELDYLEGNESFSEEMVDRTGKELEDLLVSVHYLPGRGGMRCIDYTPLDFRENLLSYYGSMDIIVEEYFDRVEQAVIWAGRLPGRKRLGHLNLIQKFHTVLPEADWEQADQRIRALIPLLKKSGVGIDVNTAGLRVPTCGKPYVPEWFIQLCLEQKIECVFGSDAHRPADVGSGWDWYAAAMERAEVL